MAIVTDAIATKDRREGRKRCQQRLRSCCHRHRGRLPGRALRASEETSACVRSCRGRGSAKGRWRRVLQRNRPAALKSMMVGIGIGRVLRSVGRPACQLPSHVSNIVARQFGRTPALAADKGRLLSRQQTGSRQRGNVRQGSNREPARSSAVSQSHRSLKGIGRWRRRGGCAN